MSWIEIIADRKIRDAVEEGAFDNLEGRGKPLRLDLDLGVPPEQRMALRLMKEANILPDWIEADRDVRRRRDEWSEKLRQFEATRQGELARHSAAGFAGMTVVADAAA